MEHRRVGSVDVYALIDNVQTYPATAVYPQAGDALKGFAGYLDANGGLVLNFACFLLVDGSDRVLVDTGWGPEANGKLMEELRATPIAAADVTAVAFTHLHGDHTGWNIDRASGQPLFRNARYLVPKGDWDHYRAQTPPPDSFARDITPLEALNRVDLVEGEQRLGRSLTTLPTPGHTPGHTSVVIDSSGERGFILGDIVISQVDAEMPSLQTAFDSDHAMARATREATIRRLAGDRSLVGSSHLPVPGFGRFVITEGKSGWQAC
jgi:glyoxylase-like metal-dependent hydrolase (beta-lactamase superfamily II)